LRPRKSEGTPMSPANPEFSRSVTELQAFKSRIHRQVMEQLNLRILDTLAPDVVRQQIGDLVRDILVREDTPLNQSEREAVITEVQDEIMGYGPIEPLLRDPTVSDILVNTYRQVYVERRGKLEKTAVIFQNNDHLMRIIEKIASSVGRRIDEASPMVDARLPDGSRVNAIVPPLAIDGPILSIRKFSVDP